ncbi:ABC transporter substrate-binding protein [Rhizobium sp. SSA_523]|uniref:ABC transporter substrate-binding protein n=1 Tax=Rhizobium sp. SSA_523 TaxID=2952477 RepID=UPI002090399F|nr:ABC transporter substrate-binding protein [Rhizobium sp. SSA_523]MCO5732592.1 ABC transporter substrate-binding protein [Rhizobium sp. SSA_523]WKC23769.1 ABC transporter substrate-binding protein [Rhizobium sp. SSA_523]
MASIKLGMTSTFMALALAGVAFGAAPASAAGKVTVSIATDPGSWDPVDTFLVAWGSVGSNIFDGLTSRDTNAKIGPGLATSWEVLDNGLRVRFALREGVKFHNGEAFNADAVKYTFDRLLGEEGAKGPQRANYTSIDRVEVIDEKTVDFHLKAADPVLITKLAGYGAMIVPPQYIKEKGEDYFNAHPVGTGPFSFVAYNAKIDLQLKANPDYWGGAAKISELDYRFISEPATAVAELQAGRVDLVIDLPISLIPVVEGDSKLAVESTTGPVVNGLRFNTKDGITKDERVRKALIMAVDRATIIQSLLGGQATEIASFQSALSFGDDPSLKPLPYDPAKAKALLAEAGVKPGTPVQIDIRSGNPTFNEVSQAIAAYLQTVGINATVKPYETNVFLNDIVPQGKTGAMFQQSWGGWTLDYDNTAYLLYHSGQKWNPYDADPKLDTMLEEQRPMTDVGQREKLLQGIAGYIADKALEMPLYNLNAIYGVNKRVKDFVAAPDNRVKLNEVSVAE